MKLSLKQKALLQTLGLFAIAIVSGTTVALILEYVSTKVILNAIGVGVISWFGYLFYSITLSRLEHEDSLKELYKKD
jgi:hypothetical protein